MDITDFIITLDTTLKQLKRYPCISRNTLFLLKEYGVTNVRDLLQVDPINFLETKGVGKNAYLELKEMQDIFKQLLIEHDLGNPASRRAIVNGAKVSAIRLLSLFQHTPLRKPPQGLFIGCRREAMIRTQRNFTVL